MSTNIVSPAEGDHVGGIVKVRVTVAQTDGANGCILYVNDDGTYRQVGFIGSVGTALDGTLPAGQVGWDFNWNSTVKAIDKTTALPDGTTVKIRANPRVPSGTTPIPGIIRTVVTQQGIVWPKDVNADPLGGPVKSLTNWLGAVFGSADVGPNSIDAVGTPAVTILDRNDPDVPAGAPAYAQKVVRLIAGQDPLRADARAEISMEYSGPTGPLGPYVDANGVEWYSPEWLTDRTNIDPHSAGQTGREGDERWFYDAFCYDPDRPPLPGYLITDAHAKYGVNFTMNAGSTPDTMNITVRGGEFEAIPDNPAYTGNQPLYTPAWAKDTADPRYTGYYKTYMTAPSGGPYYPKWYKDSGGTWRGINDAALAPAGVTVYDRRPGERPGRAWNFTTHQEVTITGAPGNGVPGIIYGQGYQRTFTFAGVKPGWNTRVHHVIWSADKSKGMHQIWLNGQLALDLQGIPTLYHWVNTIGNADCHLGVSSDVDGVDREGWLTVYEQRQCYAAGMKAPDGSNVPDPPCCIYWAPYQLRTNQLSASPF